MRSATCTWPQAGPRTRSNCSGAPQPPTQNSAECWSSFGRAQHALAHYDEALSAYGKALALNPRNVEVVANCGAALIKLERFDEALAAIDQALAIVGDNPQIWFNRGLVLQKIGRLQEAATAYDRAVGLKPDQPEFWQNRGSLLQRLKDPQGALDSFDRVLALRPRDAEGLNGRASALNDLGRFDEALVDVDKAIEIDPGRAIAHGNRGNILFNLYRVTDAIASFRRAAALEPDNPSHHTNLIFALNFDPSLTVADHQAERARFEEKFGRPLAAQIRPHNNDPDPNRRLRIGYVSGHFRHQAATYNFGGVIVNHDCELFDVVCYSDTRQEDDVTEKLRARADTWHNITTLSDKKLADLVRVDKIDILVDLVGHMGGNRLLAFARKPAPVQVTSWGEQNGTGLTAIDYFLADPVFAPESYRPLLAEKTVDLLNFAAYWTPGLLPEPSPLPALWRGYVTFGSFNRLLKVQEQAVACWSKILKAVPSSRLVLKEPRLAEEHQCSRMQAMFAAHGIPRDRLTLLPGTDRFSHFRAYHDIDIALDPFPHGGGITTLDALWMGVPVVATPGPTLSCRQAAACLTTVGATEFIAQDYDAYVSVAAERARDLDALAQLRGSLRQRMFDSGITDLPRYARGVEQAYRTMWQTWCERQAGRS